VSYDGSWSKGSVPIPPDTPLDPDPVIEAYKKDVDRTLIRENLKLTVEERIEKLMRLQQLAEEMRRAGKAARRQ
jgi:hypothetical protein